MSFPEQVHAEKHRVPGESLRQACNRVADALKDNSTHYKHFRGMLMDGRFSPGGRVWAAMGAARDVTAYNCFVSGTIDDSMDGIMKAATEAARTLRLGGGIGYDFSPLRPSGSLIRSLESHASGPVSFMHIFDAVCGTIKAAGHRRGAQMGTLRIDHPDILQFIRAKQTPGALANFNVSVLVTDAFMNALEYGLDFDLTYNSTVYSTVKAEWLWAEIMRSTWDHAEPGVLFIDTINRMNNLYYCEDIAATNPCGELPLPPYGACLLGSFNAAAYMVKNSTGVWKFDLAQFEEDIPHAVRAMDNVVDRARYPLPRHEAEAKSKRRMGIGVMGVANAIEAKKCPYGSPAYVSGQTQILQALTHGAYIASIELAQEKGAFPLFSPERYPQGKFIETLPKDIRTAIAKHGIRNSHLISIAPTGTISMAADNVSSGIEPTFSKTQLRRVTLGDGRAQEQILHDYGVGTFGNDPRTVAQCTVDDHMDVLLGAVPYVDSAISKTVNVPRDIEWEDFKDIYIRAYMGGAKGITTYRPGNREDVLVDADAPAATCDVQDPNCQTCG